MNSLEMRAVKGLRGDVVKLEKALIKLKMEQVRFDDTNCGR